MNKTIFSVGVGTLLLWILIACTPTISPTPTQAATPTQFLDSTIMPTHVIATSIQISTTDTLPEAGPTPSKEQIQEIIGKLPAENSNCTNPCLWGFKPGDIEKEEIFDFFNLLNKKPKSNEKNGGVQYNLSTGYKDNINVSTTFILNQEQSLLIGIQSAIHGLYYPEVANDWAAFRPETILKIYGDPSSIEFDLSYPTEPTTDPTIGYDVIFRYEASHFTVRYIG